MASKPPSAGQLVHKPVRRRQGLLSQDERLVLDRGELLAQTRLLSLSDDHASVGEAIFILPREIVYLAFEIENSPVKG